MNRFSRENEIIVISAAEKPEIKGETYRGRVEDIRALKVPTRNTVVYVSSDISARFPAIHT
jgi:hypothetical protein